MDIEVIFYKNSNLLNMCRKKCKKCLKDKEIREFYVNSTYKDGYSSKCTQCTKGYYRKNKEKRLEYAAYWRKNNPNYKKEYDKVNVENNFIYRKQYGLNPETKEKHLSYNRKENKNYFVDHREKNRKLYRYYQAKYRATKKKATLLGFENEIKEIYKHCPEGYHVDHIIPLQHVNMCGLHVPWNLQYLPAEENLRKSNKIEVLYG